ncbi:hypothetical protein CMQ_3148 [Grosmannia clavigera kw1407]|uniref:KaiC-like domain-containing protein n=1 Tax=Grosmannia clavigera (strain kw1407 / UAMH 11150) TaxID=655863 RepID=F0XHP1_GROCL|nr:uncharacterized protein CMQ_3148 [Grosmannia clavigera kw1407]EFX03219.1 hypothetical protein CMQ_3148 [Grosmannia clavigera kw1407]
MAPVMDSIVPPKLASHFRAAKSSRLLTATNVDDAGSGWLLVRLLGDWIRLCAGPAGDGKSDIAVVVFSLYRDFDFYAAGLSQFGIDLRRHETNGHFKFIGGIHAKLLGESPSLTIDAALDLLSDEVELLKQSYSRTVLLLDSPELALTLVSENPHDASSDWLTLLQGVIHQFHHTIVAMSLDSPRMGRTRHEFEQAMARVSSVKALGHKADMSMVLRHYQTQNSKTDGTIRISYTRQFEASGLNVSGDEETFGYQILADGRTVTIDGPSL